MTVSPSIQKGFVFAVLFVAIIGVQLQYEQIKARQAFMPLHIYPTRVIRAADLGLHNGVAALIWLNAIQQIGTVSGSYQGLVSDIDAVTELDPKFAYPYAFAELVIPGFDKSAVDDVIVIGERGVRYVDDWRVPYYLASAYLFYKDDRANAAKYFDIAARNPSMPIKMRETTKNFGTQIDKRMETKDIWQSIYESTDDEVLRDQATANLIHIEIIEGLEKAIVEYKRRVGKFPSHVDDLVTARVIREIPTDPHGFVYGVDKDGKLTMKLQLDQVE